MDTTDLAAVERALDGGAALVWIETPSNPRLKITDIAAVVERARAAGASVAVDATWTPPPLQSALELGADLVVHATTKYLAGHSDVLGGAVIAPAEDAELFERVRFLQRNEGAVPSPFDCWLTLRGLRTLPWRMRAHGQNARAVAAFLDRHPRVAVVHYPGLATHPQHAIAAGQMRDFGGMVSFEVRGGAADAMGVAGRLEVFTRATSLGGAESLVEHRRSIEPEDSPTPPGLLRLSVGLEHPDDLIADLEQALREETAP